MTGKRGTSSPVYPPTYPTIQLPNQMMRMFAVKKDYISDQVDAFPLQQVTGHRRPRIFQMKVTLGDITNDSWKNKMNIDHDLEIVKPWLYSSYLIDDDVRVSFTPGKKVAIYKIDFSEASKKNLLIKGSKNMAVILNDGNSYSFEEEMVYKTRGTEPVTRVLSSFIYTVIQDVNENIIKDVQTDTKNGRYSLSFSKNSPSTVFIKYKVSYITPEQAKINFDKELTSDGFDELVVSGKKTWEEVINQIEVEGGTDAQKRSFYTSLYRTYERMIDINEGGKYYSGYDGKVHESDCPFYVDDWVWDTYRASHPLRTILTPQMENDILNSYTLMYEQSGWMPTFPQVRGNHMCMNSYHSGALFIDGYRKGLVDYDVEKTYEGIKKNMTQATFIPWRQGLPKLEIDDFLHEHGYFPALHPGEKETIPMMDGFEKRQAVAVSLGISYDFWALGELSKELGKTEDYKKFSVKGKDYKRL